MPALAHTATSSGPNTEILLLGAGMIVLAVVFFFQKTVARQASVILLLLDAAAVTGAFALADSSAGDHHEAAIAIASPEDGATVAAGETVMLEVELTGAELASESSSEDAGHLHVLVDGESAGMPSTLDVELELDAGEHEIEVELVDANHDPLDPPVVDSVTVRAE